MPLWPLFIILAFALWVYISLWFALAQHKKRLDVIDSAWGLGFIYVALLSIFIFENFEPLPLIAVALTSLWGLRLAAHITSRNISQQEDYRYRDYRRKWKQNFALNAYFRIYIVQAVLILAISTASIGVITGRDFAAPLACAGLILWASGIIFEAIADSQMREFKKLKNDKNLLMDKGLWRYSRHPNYFGEIVVWSGASLVAVSAGAWWGLLSPIIVAILLTRVSGITLIEKRYQEDKLYQQYKKRTSMLIPLPPK